MPKITNKTLLKMLSTTRPAKSAGEKKYVTYLLGLIESLGHMPAVDEYGNIIVNTLTDDSAARVMFTAHTDSVHKVDTFTQHLLIGDGKVSVNTSKSKASTCLGADDATGNYVLLRLLQAGVSGLYVFFREEEIGGVGSDFFSSDPNNLELLKTLTHCVSFDRKGYESIITHQGSRCASDKFAKELAEAIFLQDPRLYFEPDSTGTFTDSANFTHLISECTNISVGYFNAHTKNEYQDLNFIEQLCEALTKVDWCNLGHYRTPIKESYSYGGSYWYDDVPVHDDTLANLNYDRLYEFVLNDPMGATDALYDLLRYR